MRAALRYRAAGWAGTIPLPAGRKRPPPAGFTGAAGRWPSDADVAAWLRQYGAEANLALRLPDTVIGIDVDAYGTKGAATFARLEAAAGPLPPTWTSTSRTDGVSEVALYRVPAGHTWRDPGPGVDLIHRAHRYLVVPPSRHPSGRCYRWLRPDGTEAGPDEVPRPEDLPELPASWRAVLEGVSLRSDNRPGIPGPLQGGRPWGGTGPSSLASSPSSSSSWSWRSRMRRADRRAEGLEELRAFVRAEFWRALLDAEPVDLEPAPGPSRLEWLRAAVRTAFWEALAELQPDEEDEDETIASIRAFLRQARENA
ncbi:MAG TPA: bifunctional DNA primase/polymerase [Candidatus Binatia bacterium]|nr:bifunctional DNA primase/polymerase [Candidatus Binatia bacterium]